MKMKNLFKKLSKNFKFTYLIIIIIGILFLTIALPSLARYKNRTSINDSTVWDGSIATSYRKGTGTQADPYVISNGSELAYFADQLKHTDYADTYFIINKDIVLNEGIFNYSKEAGIKYTIDDNTYNITPYTNNYDSGTINLFSTIDNFKGNLDGNSYTIYGLYITDSTKEKLGLFTNLEGNISNLYLENALIYGGSITAGLAVTANNATVTNFLYDGFVVSNTEELTKSISHELENHTKNIENDTVEEIISIDNLPMINGKIVSTKLTGTYSGNEFGTLKINNQLISNGDFELDLSKELLNQINVEYATTDTTTFNLTNLKYIIDYKYNTASGIVAEGKNITLKNTINKADIYGKITSSGLIGYANLGLNINQSYNSGNIDSSDMAVGLVASLNQNVNNVSISNSYNSGDVNGTTTSGLVGNMINDSNVTLENTFNSTSIYSIGKIKNSVVNIKNSYTITNNNILEGNSNGSFILTTIDNLKDSTFIKDSLLFNEFTDSDNLSVNQDAVWVYEDSSFPTLYIDDINNPIASINVSTYTWNNIGYELNTLKFDSSFAFNIESVDNLKPIKETYYYISKTKTPLNYSQLSSVEWQTYSDIVEISEEGFYVIYAKVIDYNDHITYLNTDLLVLDLSGSSIDIKINDSKWTDFRTELNYLYLDKATDLTISATDELSGVKNVYYYIADRVLTLDELKSLEDENWNLYNDKVHINRKGTNILYVKAIDNCNYVMYANSDYIVLAGYTEEDLIIENEVVTDNVSITNKSKITLNFRYQDTNNYNYNQKHYLIANKVLPTKTIITLIDNVNSKVYKYVTEDTTDYGYETSCDISDLVCEKKASYPLTLFSEIGKENTETKFDESVYTGNINEHFTVIIDLKNTNISDNYQGVKLSMLLDNTNNDLRNTLLDTIKTFNIYSSVSGESTKANLKLDTNYKDIISYNSNSVNNITLNYQVDFKYMNRTKIFDTTYENKKLGLAIELLDADDKRVAKEHLKNLIFKVGDQTYLPSNDGVIRINLDSSVKNGNKTLTIETVSDNIKLKEGEYHFRVGLLAAYDGLHDNTVDTIDIPVIINNTKFNRNYGFEVIMNNEQIISKSNESVLFDFNVVMRANLKKPNIRVSLYKKEQLTAYNQTYNLIDLDSYTSDSLNKQGNSIYYVSLNPINYNGSIDTYNNFKVNMQTLNLENTGYKFIFELYDGNKKIGTIDKKFIVK